MRPLYMKVEAFGPYAGSMEYPMEQLGADGIYLLTGHTGAGKTTLFDGISYALFREGSGLNRKEAVLRNTSVDKKVYTSVELLFSVGMSKYRVTRSYRPAQTVKGNVTRENKLEVYSDGNLKGEPQVYVKGEVQKVLTQILKVERGQFAQIAMIAQGDFQDVLLAETTVRKAVYRQIFQTEKYETLQNKISEEYGVLHDEMKKIKASIKEKLSGVMACGTLSGADFDAVSETDQDALKDFIALDSHYDTADTVKKAFLLRRDLIPDGNREEELADLRISHKAFQIDLEEEKRQLAAEWDEINIYLAEYKRLLALKQKKENILVELRTATEKLEKARQEKEATSAYPEEISALREQLNALAIKSNVWDEVVDYRKKLAESSAKKASYESQVQQGKETVEKLREVYGTSCEKVVKLPELGHTIQNLEKECSGMKETLEKLSEMAELLQKNERLSSLLAQKQESYETSIKVHQEKHAAYGKAMKRYFSHQAGILASTLVDGEACMVCGSLEHPEKASSDGLDKETLEREMEDLQTEEETAKKSMIELEKVFSDTKDAYHLSQGEVEAQGDLLLETKDISLMAFLISEKQKEMNVSVLEKELVDMTEEYGKLKTIADSLEQLSLDLKTEEETLRKTEDALLTERTNEVSLEDTLQTKIKELEGATGESLSEEIRVAKAGIKGREDSMKAVEEHFSQVEKTYLDVKVRKRTLDEQQVAENLLEEHAAYEKREALYKEKHLLHSSKWDNLTAVLCVNQEIEDYVKKMRSKNKSKLLQSEWMAPLHKVATGSMLKEDHGIKIEFETYVQQHYFADVLAEANVVYHKMNRGRYTLVPGIDTLSNKQVGLDVLIFEENTGVTRHPKSLSGGETFQASLALALGFSSSVQKKSGAVQLESLFLDEGFGSLDGLSLDKAIEALVAVAGQGRLIGVISHVESMKGIIDKQVLFQNDENGASVEFQV